MSGFTEQLAAYYSRYQSFNARLTQYIGVPLYFLAILIFLGWIHIAVPGVFDLQLAWLGTIALLGYYFYIDWQAAAIAALCLIILNFIASFFSQPEFTFASLVIFLVLFAISFAILFYGHMKSGDKRDWHALAIDFMYTPLYLSAEILVKLGQKSEWSDKINPGK